MPNLEQSTEIAAGFMLVFGIFPALVSSIVSCARCGGNLYSQRALDAFIPVAWWNCLCADRIPRLRVLGQVQINLHTHLARTLLMAAPRERQRHAHLFLHLGIPVLQKSDRRSHVVESGNGRPALLTATLSCRITDIPKSGRGSNARTFSFRDTDFSGLGCEIGN